MPENNKKPFRNDVECFRVQCGLMKKPTCKVLDCERTFIRAFWSFIRRFELFIRRFGLFIRRFGLFIRRFGLFIRRFGLFIRRFGLFIRRFGLFIRRKSSFIRFSTNNDASIFLCRPQPAKKRQRLISRCRSIILIL